jgi:hypothetical protein
MIEVDPPTAGRLVRRLVARKHMLGGVVALRTGDRAGATAAFERARATDPNEPESALHLAAGTGVRGATE